MHSLRNQANDKTVVALRARKKDIRAVHREYLRQRPRQACQQAVDGDVVGVEDIDAPNQIQQSQSYATGAKT